MSDKKELFLILTKKWFLEILNGNKKEELRDFTDFYINKFCIFDKDGNWVENQQYSTVRFQIGYSKNAPQMIVGFKELIVEVDNDEEELTPENARFVILLGDVLEKINCENL